jgi:hypothetical protein
VTKRKRTTKTVTKRKRTTRSLVLCVMFYFSGVCVTRSLVLCVMFYFSGVRVTQSLVFCVVFYRSLFVLFLLVTLLSVLFLLVTVLFVPFLLGHCIVCPFSFGSVYQRWTDNTMVTRYQRCNQNSYIKEEQTTQWPQDTKGGIRIRILKRTRQHSLWYLFAIVLSVLLWYMDSDYTFGIWWPLCCLFFFDIRILITI